MSRKAKVIAYDTLTIEHEHEDEDAALADAVRLAIQTMRVVEVQLTNGKRIGVQVSVS